jgi:lipoprotein-anchoring transpeptidase ErfK/SrfK
VRTYPVAVGSDEYPTPTGEFTISQVTWNPDWHPPKSEWSEDETAKAPNEEGNPMGRAKLMFQAPDYTIHGTDDYDSLGKNVSHGSVRISNKVVTDLARRAMVHGGARRSEAWYNRAAKNDSDQHIVELPNPIPISIQE